MKRAKRSNLHVSVCILAALVALVVLYPASAAQSTQPLNPIPYERPSWDVSAQSTADSKVYNVFWRTFDTFPHDCNNTEYTGLVQFDGPSTIGGYYEHETGWHHEERRGGENHCPMLIIETIYQIHGGQLQLSVAYYEAQDEVCDEDTQKTLYVYDHEMDRWWTWEEVHDPEHPERDWLNFYAPAGESKDLWEVKLWRDPADQRIFYVRYRNTRTGTTETVTLTTTYGADMMERFYHSNEYAAEQWDARCTIYSMEINGYSASSATECEGAIHKDYGIEGFRIRNGVKECRWWNGQQYVYEPCPWFDQSTQPWTPVQVNGYSCDPAPCCQPEPQEPPPPDPTLTYKVFLPLIANRHPTCGWYTVHQHGR